MNERRQVRQTPSTNKRNGNKRQESSSNKPAAGFQHDDRFIDKPVNEDKEKTPDENRKPQVSQI